MAKIDGVCEAAVLLLEGVLESIPQVRCDGTTLLIKTNEGVKTLKKSGIVFPDSIGNEIIVYQIHTIYQIHDTILDRWYR